MQLPALWILAALAAGIGIATRLDIRWMPWRNAMLDFYARIAMGRRLQRWRMDTVWLCIGSR